jgi:hypothetical protein
MIADSADWTPGDVTTFSSTPAKATAARVPTAYSAVLMPASRPSFVNRRIKLSTVLPSPHGVAEDGDDHRRNAGKNEGGKKAQSKRQHDEHADAACRRLDRRVARIP